MSAASRDVSLARRRIWRNAVLAVALVLMVALSPFLLIAFAFWAADGAWRFEGDSGVRYWMFVQGTRLERLGFVERAGPPRYSISLQEGNFPGWSILSYDSNAQPAAILATYAQHCNDMSLKVTKGPIVSEYNADTLILVCEIEKYLDAEFAAKQKPPPELTHVTLRVWGSD